MFHAPSVGQGSSRVASTPLAFAARILVPIDLSVACHQALEAALAMQACFGSEVRVVMAVEYGENDDFLRGIGDIETPGELEDAAMLRLGRFLENVVPGAGSRVSRAAFIEEDLVHATKVEAERWNPTLILAALPRHTSLFRSAAERLARDTDLPVLLLPAG
jgi:nucleotide-binding universal stress UspA family protein